MDILVEIILEVYMELMMLIVPEKNISKKHIVIAKVLAIAMIALVFGLVIWGCVLLIEKDSLLGVIPIAVAVAISAAQIVFGIVLYKKNH